MVKKSLALCLLSVALLFGCKEKPFPDIPGIPKDHPANDFYQFVSQNMVSDKVCLDRQGNPGIPMGEIVKGGRYSKSPELIPGVFRFSDATTGKKYLGVSFLQYQGLLQIPKVCAWEEENRV